MRKAKVNMYENEAGILLEYSRTHYAFQYLPNYHGDPISLTMPVKEEPYIYDKFPPFFEGLLPEGYNKNQLLSLRKIDERDYFSILMYIGQDVVGATTISEITNNDE